MSSFCYQEKPEDTLNLGFPLLPDFLVDKTVEHKDEESLKRVEDGEEVDERW